MAEEIKETNVMVIPFGNGVERMLDNKNTKCEIKNIDFNRHSVKDIVKGTL